MTEYANMIRIFDIMNTFKINHPSWMIMTLKGFSFTSAIVGFIIVVICMVHVPTLNYEQYLLPHTYFNTDDGLGKALYWILFVIRVLKLTYLFKIFC